eukprot:1568307-Pyramimonas_sp.AAC.2
MKDARSSMVQVAWHARIITPRGDTALRGDRKRGDNTGGDNTGGDNTGGDNTGGDNVGVRVTRLQG